MKVWQFISILKSLLCRMCGTCETICSELDEYMCMLALASLVPIPNYHSHFFFPAQQHEVHVLGRSYWWLCSPLQLPLYLLVVHLA